jgi:hypothetical protein
MTFSNYVYILFFSAVFNITVFVPDFKFHLLADLQISNEIYN